MDEVLEKLQTTDINPEISNKSVFEDLYKNRGKYGNQDERRSDLLQAQKNNRNCKLDTVRGILDLVQSVENHNIFKTKYVHYKPSIYVAGFTRASPSYNKVVMLSEWLLSKPNDFRENWYVLPCPKGSRMLAVTTNGKTKFFSKYGQFKFSQNTLLPGGNIFEYGSRKHKCCVLDCFYSDTSKIMYVLDLLAWSNQPMTDCETEFRYYWLKRQFEEIPGLNTRTKKNGIIFSLLPMVDCSKESFDRFMMTYPPFEAEDTELDGFLFYHKRSHYESGQTPLVGWLYPFMVSEVLDPDMQIHEKYLVGKPHDYVNKDDYIQKFEESMEMKKKSRRKNRVSMDTSDVSSDVSKETIDPENTEKSETTQKGESSKTDDMESQDISP